MGINIAARRRRLVVLADFLEGTVLPMLDGAKFDMANWGSWEKEGGGPRALAQTSECGFEGCALGWAFYCPSLVRAGVRRLLVTRYYRRDLTDVCEAMEFFGLDGVEFWRAFIGPESGPDGVRRVVGRLRRIATESPSQVGP